jgi:branched-chain amino acid transport system ATP-binding protein
VAEVILETRGLRKAFGALAATDGVDLELREGETHAVIGPNGAGKTTLIGQLAGNLRPDAGSIRFAGEDVTRLSAPQRAKQGFARSFQITSIYRDLTALDNVALAVQARAGSRSDRSARCSRRSGWANVPTCSPPISRTASSASSKSPWRSPRARACCCWTSRSPAWGWRSRSAWCGSWPA